jgi:hypothetical protein
LETSSSRFLVLSAHTLEDFGTHYEAGKEDERRKHHDNHYADGGKCRARAVSVTIHVSSVVLREQAPHPREEMSHTAQKYKPGREAHLRDRA